MKKNNLFIAMGLLLMGHAAQGMTKTAGQVETKAKKAQAKEEVALSPLMAKLRETDEKRLQELYETFHKAAQKFVKERIDGVKFATKYPNSTVRNAIGALVQQAFNLGRYACYSETVAEKGLAERRMRNLIAIGESWFALDETENDRIAPACRVINEYLGMPYLSDERPKKFDGMGFDLWANKLLPQDEAELLADAFTGWSQLGVFFKGMKFE